MVPLSLFRTYNLFSIHCPRFISVTNACAHLNGGCSQLCLPTGEMKKTCKCTDGYELQEDNKTCKGKHIIFPFWNGCYEYV